jgi:hypothetical protein
VIRKLRGKKKIQRCRGSFNVCGRGRGGRFSLSPENDLLMFTDVVHQACILVLPTLWFKVKSHFREMVMHAAFKGAYKTDSGDSSHM